MRATLFLVAFCVVASTADAQLQWSLENVSTNGGGLVVGEVSGTALVSDGTALYLLKKDAGRIYTSVTGASGTWSLLTTTPGGPASDNGSLANWNGKLVTRRDNQSGQECDRSYVLYVYDLSAHTWSQREARGFGDHSFVAAGDHLYGMIHAAGSNQGGPFARVNLAAGGLDAFACNRFHVDGQLAGADSTWFSRGAQITALGTTLYGFKNDWRTNPAGDGDRLFAINTAWPASGRMFAKNCSFCGLSERPGGVSNVALKHMRGIKTCPAAEDEIAIIEALIFSPVHLGERL